MSEDTVLKLIENRLAHERRMLWKRDGYGKIEAKAIIAALEDLVSTAKERILRVEA